MYLGYICKKTCPQDVSKIDQSDHNDSIILVVDVVVQCDQIWLFLKVLGNKTIV